MSFFELLTQFMFLAVTWIGLGLLIDVLKRTSIYRIRFHIFTLIASGLSSFNVYLLGKDLIVIGWPIELRLFVLVGTIIVFLIIEAGFLIRRYIRGF